MAENNTDNKASEAASAEEDEELSALLDNAVEDFDKAEKTDKSKSDESKTKEADAKPTPPDTLWTNDFLSSNQGRMNMNFASLFSPGPDGSFNMAHLGEEIQRLAEGTTTAAGFETSPDAEFSSIIAQTLKNLSEGTETLNSQLTDEDMMNMLGSFGNLAEGDGDPGELLPFMQKMMQNLLSKEILHPALSSLVEKYPAWLEENSSKLSPEDLARYQKQHAKMGQVCVELEAEGPDDSEQVKRTRFDKVLVLMQEIQDCGQPPAELVEDAGPLLDDQGRPQIPPGMTPDQCVLQ